jgi:hypothetical protein
MVRAEDVEIEINPSEGSVKTRVLRPEYIVVTALAVGRPRDRIRITRFLDEQAVDLAALRDVLERHGLRDAWRTFCRHAGIPDPCDVQQEP